MKEQNEQEQPRSRVKKGSNSFVYFAIVVVLLLGLGFYFNTTYLTDTTTLDSSSLTQKTHENSLSQSVPSETATDRPELLTFGKNQPNEGDVITQETGSDSTVSLFDKNDPTKVGQQQPVTDEYQNLIDELNLFYSHLDQQPYMQAFNLKEPSKVHFSKVLQKLVDNPPVVTQETNDLFTLLKNTAHFFRILGKDNIIILKGILDREKKSFEQTLKNFYTLTYHPEYLEKEYSLTIPFDALYDYAGFFLNTMGGRLYLFRRDSTSRLAVSYYAILVVDRANDTGSSRHGIDLRPAIDSLIEEIENGGKRLRLKDDYLDKLYDLKEKYN